MRAANPVRRQSANLPSEVQFNEIDDLADLLDTRWRIPGTGIRFGLDAIAGLVPGVGDVAAGAVSAYVIYKAAKMGAPSHLLGRMAANVAVDTLVGSVPVLGSVFDLFFKANRRNVEMLRRHLKG